MDTSSEVLAALHRELFTFASVHNNNISHHGNAAMANLACLLQVDEHLPLPVM